MTEGQLAIIVMGLIILTLLYLLARKRDMGTDERRQWMKKTMDLMEKNMAMMDPDMQTMYRSLKNNQAKIEAQPLHDAAEIAKRWGPGSIEAEQARHLAAVTGEDLFNGLG